jgi:cell division initiation protein
MALTPVEIRHLKFKRGLRGYDREAVDEVIDEVANSFEETWRERADLRDRVETLEAELLRFRELESLLRQTLVSAERASHDVRDQAKREADLIVSEAHAEAREVTRRASSEHERLLREAQTIRAQLRSALAVVAVGEPKPAGEDTAEFQAA